MKARGLFPGREAVRKHHHVRGKKSGDDKSDEFPSFFFCARFFAGKGGPVSKVVYGSNDLEGGGADWIVFASEPVRRKVTGCLEDARTFLNGLFNDPGACRAPHLLDAQTQGKDIFILGLNRGFIIVRPGLQGGFRGWGGLFGLFQFVLGPWDNPQVPAFFEEFGFFEGYGISLVGRFGKHLEDLFASHTAESKRCP